MNTTINRAEIEASTWGINNNDIQLTTNGIHQFIEVISDKKVYIFDNMNPNGILKENWIKTLEVLLKGEAVPLVGEEAYKIAEEIK